MKSRTHVGLHYGRPLALDWMPTTHETARARRLAVKLVMFDIDGTLTQSDDADAACFIQALEDVFGFTVDYMAPEQALDTKTADARADIYSLGCTLHRLLTGKNVYDGETLVQKLLAHQNTPIPALGKLRPDVPTELAAIFERMIAKRPADRFQLMAEVVAALAPLAADSRDYHSSTGSSGNSGTTRYPASSPTIGTPLDATLAPCTSLANAFPQPPTDQTLAPTIALVNPLQGTEPVSDRSIQIVREHPSHLRQRKRGQGPPWQRNKPLLIVGGIGGLLLLLLGIWVIVRDKDGNEAGRIEVPDGGKAEIVETGWHGWPADAPKPAIAPFDAAQAKIHQEEWAACLKVPAEYTNSIGMKFRLIPPGEFLMGTPPAELETLLVGARAKQEWFDLATSEGPQHKVILTQPIYLGMHEVTQMQYQQVIGQNPSQFDVAKVGKDTSKHPVEMVSWNDAADFCTKLSEKEGLQPFEFGIRNGDEVAKVDTGYRLPTEAEWEFASRGGTTTRHWFGESDDNVSQAAWLRSNSQLRTHSVGELLANPFGLFDIGGNLEEWMYDGWELNYYAKFRDRPAIDPMGVTSEVPTRTTRGSYWDGDASSCRISRRFAVEPTGRHHTIGFRTAISVDAVRKAEKARKGTSENPSSSVPR